MLQGVWSLASRTFRAKSEAIVLNAELGESLCADAMYVGVTNKSWAEHFRAQPNPPELSMPDAEYNVAPTTHQPIIRQSKETGDRELILARWGLVPFFTKDIKDVKGLSTINARSETITKAPTWREPFKKRPSL